MTYQAADRTPSLHCRNKAELPPWRQAQSNIAEALITVMNVYLCRWQRAMLTATSKAKNRENSPISSAMPPKKLRKRGDGAEPRGHAQVQDEDIPVLQGIRRRIVAVKSALRNDLVPAVITAWPCPARAASTAAPMGCRLSRYLLMQHHLVVTAQLQVARSSAQIMWSFTIRHRGDLLLQQEAAASTAAPA